MRLVLYRNVTTAMALLLGQKSDRGQWRMQFSFPEEDNLGLCIWENTWGLLQMCSNRDMLWKSSVYISARVRSLYESSIIDINLSLSITDIRKRNHSLSLCHSAAASRDPRETNNNVSVICRHILRRIILLPSSTGLCSLTCS